MPGLGEIEAIAAAVKAGQEVVMNLPKVYDAYNELYKRFEGATDFRDRTRSIELLIINGSTEELRWADPYFDSGTTFWGPIPMNIEPTGTSLWAVANRQGSVATGVSGAGKWFIEGTDLSLIIGFTNPYIGSYKHQIGIREQDESAQWGYDNSVNEQAKQYSDESGYYVSVTMDEPEFSPYKRFIYTITNA